MKPLSGCLMNGACAHIRKEVIHLQEKKDLKAIRNAFCCYYVMLGMSQKRQKRQASERKMLSLRA